MFVSSVFGSKTAVATMSLTGTFSARMETIAKAGFNTVELYLDELPRFGLSPSQIRRAAADFGLTIVCAQPLRDYEGIQPSRRGEVHDMAYRVLDWCWELEAPLLSICSNTLPHAVGDWNCIADDLTWLAERAKSRGISLGYEPLSWGTHISDYSSAATLIDFIGHDHLGLTLDCFHWFTRKQPLSLLSAIPASKVVHVQLADGRHDSTLDFLQLSRFHRLPLGEGQFPCLDFLRILKRTGYRGSLSLEIFNPERFALSNRMLELWYGESFNMLMRLVCAENELATELSAGRALTGALQSDDGEHIHGH